MFMGLKYQTPLTVQPEELYFVTMKHLDTMKQLLEGTQAADTVTQVIYEFEKMA